MFNNKLLYEYHNAHHRYALDFPTSFWALHHFTHHSLSLLPKAHLKIKKKKKKIKLPNLCPMNEFIV